MVANPRGDKRRPQFAAGMYGVSGSLGAPGEPDEPVYVKIVSEPSPPWWLITVGTVVVTYLTQSFLSKRVR